MCAQEMYTGEEGSEDLGDPVVRDKASGYPVDQKEIDSLAAWVTLSDLRPYVPFECDAEELSLDAESPLTAWPGLSLADYAVGAFCLHSVAFSHHY